MVERLLQLGFDEQFRITTPKDVTPEQFMGLTFLNRREKIPLRVSEIGRFVREAQEVVQIASPADAGHYLLKHVYTPFEAFDQEELWVLLLNTKNRITHEAMVYRGTINKMYVRGAELFKEAIRVNAMAMILAHCHPSGDPTPSPEDVQVTRHTVEVARLLEIDVLDHIVMGQGSWVSMKERGLGFDI